LANQAKIFHTYRKKAGVESIDKALVTARELLTVMFKGFKNSKTVFSE